MHTARQHDPVDALVPTTKRIEATGSGPLDDIDVVVKDIVGIAEHTTSFGSARWRETHDPATSHAPAIAALLDAGATIVGLAKMEELAFSLIGNAGERPHPQNTHCPDLWCGGSSSGSAAAVGAGMAPLALGTDTGGSMRVPAAACAVNGIRPTHGVIDQTGFTPLAATFDTPGFFADDCTLIATALRVVAPSLADTTPFRRVLAPIDLWDDVDTDTARVLREATARIASHLGVTPTEAPMTDLVVPETSALFTRLELKELWDAHGAWLVEHAEALHHDIRGRVLDGRQWQDVSPAAHAADVAAREDLRRRSRELLGDDGVAIVPIRFDQGPRRDASDEELLRFRRETFRLTGLASHTGQPQVVATVQSSDSGAYVAVGMLGPHGSDLGLLALAAEVFGSARTTTL